TFLYVFGPSSDEIFASLHVQYAHPNQPTYREVKDAFDRFYESKDNLVYERCTFLRKKQAEGETIEQFISDLYRSGEKCRWDNIAPGSVREEMISLVLISGIKDEKLSTQLQFEKDIKLSKIIEMCKQREKVIIQQRALRAESESQASTSAVACSDRKTETSGGDSAVNYVRTSAPSKTTTSKSMTKCEKCGSSHQRYSCPASDKKCFKCSRFGHFSRCCKNTKRSFRSN